MSTLHKITSDLVTQRLNVGNNRPVSNITALSDPIADTPMVVTLDQLRPYENNPRIMRNPAYDDIKDSIRQRGLDNPPPITRRPGEEHFIICNGGNTRLQILTELWKETHEERFYRISCLFKPWRSEASALIGHLAENELRGSLTFIEKALGIQKLKEFYESDGKQLTLRGLSERIKEDGFPISFQLAGRMMACLNHLLPAIPQTLYAGLGKHQIEKLLSLRSALAQIFKHYRPDDEPMFNDFWIMTLSQFDLLPDGLNLVRIQDELLGSLSGMTGQGYKMLELDLIDIQSGHGLSKHSMSGVDIETEAEPLLTATTPPEPSPVVQPVPSPVFTAAEVSYDEDETEAAVEVEPMPLAARETVLLPSPAGMSEEQREQRIGQNIVSPSGLTPRVQDIRQKVEQHFGGTLPDFEQNVLQSVPVQAGGLAPVSDVWFIERQIDSPEGLREQIHLLALEIADYGDNASSILKTQEGLGFGIQGGLVSNTPRSTAVGLLLTSILRLHEQADSELSAALFCQILIGGYSIRIGHSDPQDIGLERLPDVLLVKLFRLIRLARRLVDLESGELS